MNHNQYVFNQAANPTFNGLAIIPNYTMLPDYLLKIKLVFDKALMDHSRTFVIRFDLHMPIQPVCVDIPNPYYSNVISKFIDSFKAHIKADLNAKRREGKRVHETSIRYVWVKEQNTAQQAHYHVALFLNHDTYFSLGDYNSFGNNLVSKIYSAWASALSCEYHFIANLIHFPSENPTYFVDVNSHYYNDVYSAVFYRLSYLAKLETKVFGTKEKNFGYSLK